MVALVLRIARERFRMIPREVEATPMSVTGCSRRLAISISIMSLLCSYGNRMRLSRCRSMKQREKSVLLLVFLSLCKENVVLPNFFSDKT